MDENDYNELFGLKPKGGGENTEPEEGQAAPAERGSAMSGGEPSANEPGPGETGGSRDDEGTESGSSEGGKDGRKPEQKDKLTARHTDEKRRAVADDETYLDGAIRSLGIVDPYTNKPITTRAQYDAYNERAYKERRQRILDRSGMTEEELDEFIAALPEVRKAREDSGRAEALIRREREREARARVDAEVAKIAAMDPSVKSIADLTTGENYDKLLSYVKRGYELSDAWTLANFGRLREMAQASARQAAHNSQEGRAGMERSRQRGQGDNSVPVPKDVKELYQTLNPGASDEEIRKYYNDYMKGRK